MPKIYPRYGLGMHKIYTRYAQDVHKICPRYTWGNLSSITKHLIFFPSIEKGRMTWTMDILQHEDQSVKQPPKYSASPEFFNLLLE